MEWLALVTAIINSGLADKIISLIIQLFNGLTPDNQVAVSNKVASLFVGKPTA